MDGQVLPHNWIIEWNRFDEAAPIAATLPARGAQDRHAACPYARHMPNEGNDGEERIKELLKHLARRNLRRGYQLSLPTGQALARGLGIQPLSRRS